MSNNQEICVGEEILKIIEKSVEAGVNAGIARGIKEIENSRLDKLKKKTDIRKHNTALLLRNYNKFKKHISAAIYSEEQLEENTEEENMTYNEYLIVLMEEQADENFIKSIMRSMTRTKIILKHIDSFLEYYFIRCANSERDDIRRRGEVIQYLYINEEDKILTFEETANKLNVNIKTVARDRKKAIEELSALFFGIDGLKIN